MTRPLWLVALFATTSCLIIPNPCADCAGCCSQGACVAGTQSSACGKGGAACFDCGKNLCTAGVCASGGTGGGTSTGGGTGGAGGGLTGGGSGGGGGVSGGGGGASSPCTAGLTFCAARCVSTGDDRANCGQCGVSCTSTQACVSGQCVANPADCRQAQCLTGFYCDLSNGACREGCASNTQCPQPGTCDTASRTCACAAGSQRCGDACVPSSSTDSCGASCIRCEKANATAACTAAACVYTCNPGFHRCGADCAADDSVTQCGASCSACPGAPANGSAECVLQPGTGGTGGGGGAATVRSCDFFCAPGFLKCGAGCCRAVALAAGGSHTCAVTSAGTVKCWGNQERSTKPVDVEGFDAGVTALTSGTNHTCALRTDGRAVCWGGNDYGQLGDNSGTPSYLPVDVSGGLTFASLSAGAFSTCGVTTAGGAKCWGDNPYGQVGNGTYSPTQCTVGDCHPFDVPYSVVGLSSGVAAVSSGWGHACARLSTGAVSCWGRNYFGELGATTPSRSSVPLAAVVSDASILAAGDMNTCALTPAGLVCWGGNFDGSLGIGTTMHSPTPVMVGLSGVTNVWGGMGGVHCATSPTGLSCWGQNNRGQVGDGTLMSRSLPTTVAIGPVSAVVTGDEHTCALSQGAVYCWGANNEGQLGDGTYTDRSAPMVVSGH